MNVGLPGIAAGVIVMLGPAGTGLFTTVAAQSRRLRAVSPSPPGSSRPRPADPADRPTEPAPTLTSRPSRRPGYRSWPYWPALTLAWPLVQRRRSGRGRRVLPPIRHPSCAGSSVPQQHCLRSARRPHRGWPSSGSLESPARPWRPRRPRRRSPVPGSATLLGLGLIATWLRVSLPARWSDLTAAALFVRLGWLEQLLTAAAPSWKRLDVLQQPT
ncbi:hypothetical protein HBB16_13940 [Pseudonocardia sp. MCCB 268]|nr:hypothetical protein [Pseudonocardia cytotoxica]